VLYAFFWVIPWCLNSICRHFGTLCLFNLWLGLRNVGVFIQEKVWIRLFSSQTFSHINIPTFLKPSHSSHLPAYEDWTERSKMLANRIQTPGNYPEESIQHSENGKSLKSRILCHELYLTAHLNSYLQFPHPLPILEMFKNFKFCFVQIVSVCCNSIL
jgi:hypothetical protein